MFMHVIFPRRYDSTSRRGAIVHFRNSANVTCRAVATPCARRFVWYFHDGLLCSFTSFMRSFASKNTAVAQNFEARNSCQLGAALHWLVRPSFRFFRFHFLSHNSPISRFCPSGDASYGEWANGARANEGARPGFRRRRVRASLNSRKVHEHSRTRLRAVVVDARCRVSMKEASR